MASEPREDQSASASKPDDDSSSTASSGRRSRRRKPRSPRRRAAGIVGLIIVAYLVLAAGVGVSAALEARKGQAAVSDLSGAINLSALQRGDQDAKISEAAAHLRTAHDRLDHPVLAPVRAVPWVGTQVKSAAALTGTAAETADLSLDLLKQVRSINTTNGANKAELLKQVSTITAEADTKLLALAPKLGPREGLVGPLASVRAEAVDRLNELESALSRGSAAADGLQQLLTSNGRYLFVAANNAEMRNGSGMFLQAGLMTTSNGNFSISDLESTGNLAKNANTGAVQWTGDLENWSWLGREGDMRNLMLSPRFDVNAPLAKEIWEKAGNPSVDGVITVDIEMMRALLATVGPVSAQGKTVNADNARQFLLYDQYAGIDYNSETQRETADRREALAAIAGLAFDKFSEGKWDLGTAARQFGSAAQGRHLMIWSTDQTLNAKWVKAGVGGTMTSADTMVSLTNLGTNKLDQFMKVNTALETGKTSSSTVVTMRITLTNTAPADGPRYVLGPIANSKAAPGEYIGLLTISLPGDSTGIKFDSDLPLSVAGRDGDNAQVAVGVDVARGGTQTFVLRFSRPADAVFTTVQPSAHLPEMQWTYRDEQWSDSAPNVVKF